jgi:hypothetical protein
MSKTASLQFFDVAHQHFLASVRETREVRKFYRLAGFTISLSFAGDTLVDFLTPALEHVEIGDGEKADLTICIWDGASTPIPPLEFPWPNNSFAMHGNVIGYNSDRIHTVFDSWMNILQAFDKKRDLALYWIKDRQKTPWWVGTSPLLFILHWWMRTRGHQLTHAAVVGYPQGGVLIAGKSGAGKSTTALSCMRAGMKYVSEDYCLLSDLPDIRAYSLYNSAKIKEETLRLFPEFCKYIENSERPKEDKAFFFHQKFQPENILTSCPLKALITLQIEEAKDSWLEPIWPIDAMAALSGTTLWQLTHTGPAVFQHLKRVAENLPCYKLHLGSDLMQAPKLLMSLTF